MLTLVRKDEEQWWTVSNEYGRTGLVPVPYIKQVIHPSVCSVGLCEASFLRLEYSVELLIEYSSTSTQLILEVSYRVTG